MSTQKSRWLVINVWEKLAGEPIAEQTRFGWTIMYSGAEVDIGNMFLTQTSVAEYEELCRLDVLGLEYTPIGDHRVVHQFGNLTRLVRIV